MLKKLFSIILLSTVLFLGCKKDAPAYPAAIVQPPIAPPAPFVLKDSIYPRVCQGTFTIKTNTTDSQTVQLYSRWGQLLLNLNINGTTAIVDNSLTNGTYVIMITHKTSKIHGLITVLK